jgi:signal transduction histidine kinase
MYAGEMLVGELCIGSYTPGAYTDEDAWLLQAIADQTAVALENARLYEREVARAAALQEVGRLRHDFIATVSHELRTPLTSIIGFTETLLSYWDKMPEGRKLDMLSKSKAAIYRLNRLVQDLLITSGIDAEALTLESREVALDGLVEQAADEVQGKYGAQPIVTDVAPGLRVFADPYRVEQVLINLIDNAAKYSPEGAPVEVVATGDDDTVVVRVHNHGPGIAPDKQHLLFTRFGKLDTAIRAGHVGTGLGLYIARQLAEAMGGSVWLDSGEAGHTVFAFSLPSSPGTSARPHSPQDRRYT